MNKKTLKSKFDSLLDFANDQEREDQEAGLLAMRFLSRVDKEMARRKMSKKELAGAVNTSPAFITQLFRGDRKPSWNMLVKMKDALNIDFVVLTEKELAKTIDQEIMDYHRRWTKSFDRKWKGSDDVDPMTLLKVVDEDNNDFALAG